MQLNRRGFKLGQATRCNGILESSQQSACPRLLWQQGRPLVLPSAVSADLPSYAPSINASNALYLSLLDQQSCDALLDQRHYRDRWQTQFESLGSSVNQGDDQEIETVAFDVIDDNRIIAEDLWLKLSWLSFYEDDASLRFRFSFGEDLVEDVASDQTRQHFASLLCDAIFPESQIITLNESLQSRLTETTQSQQCDFVERIVYFNAPHGGAYLHHDFERGHAGVVYAQLSGSTYWLALPRYQLLEEIIGFAERAEQTEWPDSLAWEMRDELLVLANNKDELATALETFSNHSLIHCINETQAFVQTLIAHGHGQRLEAGDVIVLPQSSLESCCWHSVFCLGEQTGQALSFAMRVN